MKLHRIILLAFFSITLISCGGAEERKAVYMEKAKSSIESGNLDKARIELKNVLQIDPKDGEAYYQLGKVYEQQKEYKKAYGNYLKAEGLKPELLENHARLGRFYLLLMNDTDKAQEKIDYILSKEANNSDGLLLKAAVMLRKNKADEAIEIVKKIVEKNPNHVESVAFLASLYVRDKNEQEAISVLDAALKNNQNNQKLNQMLATILVANKDYERAESMFKGFLERNPGNASSYNNLAAFYNQVDDKANAEKILRESVANDPGNENRILILIKYIRGTKGIDEAIQELNLHVSENNRIGKLRIALAELYILNGDKKSAIKIYRGVIDYFSEEVTGVAARTALALIYINDKDIDSAVGIIDDAFLISPNDPQVNYLRAKLSLRDKNLEKAIISLRIVIKETPENIEAFLLLAAIYQQEDNKEQVNDTLNSAYENNKTNVSGLLKLAQYHLNRDIKQAEKIIDSYNSIKGVDYDGLSIKAAILNQNKNQTEAYEVAQTLMEIYPDKPNGYVQAIPYFGLKKDKESAISLLEKGYLSVKDNRKLLVLLTAFQTQEKKFDIVEKRIKAELVSSPEDIQLKIMLAKLYFINSRVDSAATVLNEAIIIDPSIEEPYILLSKIYQGKNDINAAKEVLTQGKSNLKSSLKISLSLASIYEEEGVYNNAIKIYRDLYELHPDNLIIANNLASMLSDYGNEEADLQLAKTLAVKLKKSRQAVFLDTIGWVYYKLGEYQTAIESLTQAVEKEAEVNVFNYHLGMAYKMSGDKAKARAYLEKSIVDDKQFKEKDSAIAALKDL